MEIQKSIALGYWVPWSEKGNLVDSYRQYVKDASLVKYGSDVIGQYINQASYEQVNAINKVGQEIGRGLNVLSNQMSQINESLFFLNKNLDIQIEQQKLGNLLLQNIAELLSLPESEKERRYCIELGIKFFVKAQNDKDLYADALEELLKAESLMKQDYFVLHRIGCIYLYVERFIDPEKALDYFLKAAKYAIVDDNVNIDILYKALVSNHIDLNHNSQPKSTDKSIQSENFLAADSFEKAAFASYVLGNIENAILYQEKSLKLKYTPQNAFMLAKYLVRNGNIELGLNKLEEAINRMPELVLAVFSELDLANCPEILKLIENKNDEINNKINNFINKVKLTKSNLININYLNDLLFKAYDIKVRELNYFNDKLLNIDNELINQKDLIEQLINKVKSSYFASFDTIKCETILMELKAALDQDLEQMKVIYEIRKKDIDNDEIKIGKQYKGGNVFYLDSSGKHGLVYAETNLGRANWGGEGKIYTSKEFGKGSENTKKIVELASWETEGGFFNSRKVPIQTAARICFELDYNGFKDWYLPSLAEMKILINSILCREALKFWSSEYFWTSTEYDDTGFSTNYGHKHCFAVNIKGHFDRFNKTYYPMPFVAIRNF